VSGAIHMPLLAPDKAARLLDDVIYERVLDCIDLDALFAVEVDLWAALSECDATDDDHMVKLLAKQMIERALGRIPDDPRRYASVQPFGFDCPDCEEEVLEHAKRRQGGRAS
jgi:hypothetical protein